MVSVVGAFRTGKSFMLDFFLRYLRSSSTSKTQSADSKEPSNWWETGGERLTEGSSTEDGGTPGFLWRPGKDRTTTGIWMYGTPFPRVLPSGETVAVVLMDTQGRKTPNTALYAFAGMFDMKTSMALTAAIFGLSTLISSYQIYNVTKQIQEDYLDQLDYFTQVCALVRNCVSCVAIVCIGSFEGIRYRCCTQG